MKVIKAIFLILGSIIGAGFVSGKEIFVYFSKYGIYSFLALIPLFFLLYFFIYFIFYFSKTKGLNYINVYVFKNKNIFKLFLFCCFLIISSAMFAGAASVFYLNKNNFLFYIFNLLFIIMLFFCLKKGINFIAKLNNFIVPIIFICFVFVVIFSPKTNVSFITSQNISLLPLSCFIYAMINVFLAYYVIANSAHKLTKKQTKLVSFVCSLTICFLISIAIYVELHCENIVNFDMPFLFLAQNISPIFFYIFIFAMFLAILSTLFSCLMSMSQVFEFRNKNLNILFPILISFAFSLFGFSNFVTIFYPIIGIIGGYMFFKLLFKFLFQNTNGNIHNRRQKAQNDRGTHNKV